MKKLALLLGFLTLTSQLPFCPYRVLPGDIASSLEYGREWTGVFLQAYGITDAEPVDASNNEPKLPTEIVATASPVARTLDAEPAEEPCPYEMAEAAISAMDADFPVIVESVAVTAIEPVAFTFKMDKTMKLNREEVRLEVEKTMKEVRKVMQDSKFQQTVTAARKNKARTERLRLMTVARSA